METLFQEVLNFIVMPNVVTTLECGYAFRLTFCHSANKNRYAEIISGYVPAILEVIFITLTENSSSYKTTPTDLENTHTTRKSCRDTLSYAKWH